MKLWPFFLGAWLVLHGLSAVIKLNFQYESMVMGIIALLAGILIMLRV